MAVEWLKSHKGRNGSETGECGWQECFPVLSQGWEPAVAAKVAPAKS